MRIYAALAVLAGLAIAAFAQTTVPSGRDVELRGASELDWKPSTNLPPGAEYHLVREDPTTRGIQVIVKFPAKYSVPPHSHGADETLVVLRGKLRVHAGTSDRVLGPSDYAVLPAGVEHELAVKGFGSCWVLATTNAPYNLKKP